MRMPASTPILHDVHASQDPDGHAMNRIARAGIRLQAAGGGAGARPELVRAAMPGPPSRREALPGAACGLLKGSRRPAASVVGAHINRADAPVRPGPTPDFDALSNGQSLIRRR